MDNLKLYRCLECGWELETDMHELKCPICNSKNVRVEIDEELDNSVASYLDEKNPQEQETP